MSLSRSRWIIGGSLFAAAIGILIWIFFLHSRLEDRIFRIGWESDPPFQEAGPDGGPPTGLAIELVREAARRRGLRLEWQQQIQSSEASLLAHKVDLWPLMTITEERKKLVHITDPYLESEQCLLVRFESRYLKLHDLDRATISYTSMPMNFRHLHKYLPNARLIAEATVRTSIEDVCRQITDAAFLEEYTAISALLSGLTCTNQTLRLIPIPESRPRLGVGATFESSAAADAIREEIGIMAAEGQLAEILSHYSYFSNRNLESLSALMNAKRREA